MVQRVRIFLASSAELKSERIAFKLQIQAKTQRWEKLGVELQVIGWEDFYDAIAETRLQDEYNREIESCDLFVMMFWTKVGRFTAEEFEVALKSFQTNKKKPQIFTYFKNVAAASTTAEDAASLIAFQSQLQARGHFQTVVDNVDAMNLHFSNQLDELTARGLIRFHPIRDAAALREWSAYQGRLGVRPAAPFQASPPGEGHVQRIALVDQLRQQLLGADGTLCKVTVGIHGYGGVGKTTLARLACADPRIRSACVDGMLWVGIGKNPADPRQQIADLVVALTGDDQGCATLDGARSRFQAALDGHQRLIVIDDVWDEAQIRDLLDTSTDCARLITTRRPAVLPLHCVEVDVGAMDDDEALSLLRVGLADTAAPMLPTLARQLGCWPVLLRLANGALRLRLRQKTPLVKAVDAVLAELDRKGVVAFDPTIQVKERDQAVAATLEASLELLSADQRQRYAELAIFPQDLGITLASAAELWALSANLGAADSEALITTVLEPLSLLNFDGEAESLQLHDVLRRYLLRALGEQRARLHRLLAANWTDHPAQDNKAAWRWLAHHLAQASLLTEAADRHAPTAALVALVADPQWQVEHQAALQDLPALQQALTSAIDAAVADESAPGLPLLIRAADALIAFRRGHLLAEPLFALARDGDLDAAQRRCALFTLDANWRKTLLLTVAWLAPPSHRDAACRLVDEVCADLGGEPLLVDLLAWIRADLHGEAPPRHAVEVAAQEVDDELIEQLVSRAGGLDFRHEPLLARGIEIATQNPDGPPPTRGIYRVDDPAVDSGALATTTRDLARVDAPYLIAQAAADPVRGSVAFERYLGVYAGYGYAEYRYRTLWLLLGFVVRYPRADGGNWVRQTVVQILVTALNGGSVEFEQGLAVAVDAVAAKSGDAAAMDRLVHQARRLISQAADIKSGRDHERSDIWGHHKRQLIAQAQGLGWLLGDQALAGELLAAAASIADSGFAGYQAPVDLALAEAVALCREPGPARQAEIDNALNAAQQAAHNVQDTVFCARSTARVSAMRRHWWPGFDLAGRARRLGDARQLVEFAALHRVGHSYAGRSAEALPSPQLQGDDHSLVALAALYQQDLADFVRLNGPDRWHNDGAEIAVPDPALLPLLVDRMAAEVLAQTRVGPVPAERLRWLRSWVPMAVANPTALDALLARLVLAQSRSQATPDAVFVAALRDALARRQARAVKDVNPLTVV